MGIYIYFSIGFFLWFTAIIVFFRARESAFYFLAGHLIIMGLGIVTRSLQYDGLMPEYPHFYGVLNTIQFLWGPFYLFFLLKLFNKQLVFKAYDILHLVPFLFTLVDHIPFYVLSAEQKRIMILNKEVISFLGISEIYYEYLKVISYILYFSITFRYYIRYIYYMRISDKRDTILIHYWLRADFILKGIAIAAVFFLSIVERPSSFTNVFYLYSLHVLLNVGVIYIRPSLLNGIVFEEYVKKRPINFSLSYFLRYLKMYLINGPAAKDILAQIDYLFNARQIHTDPDLDQSVLADRLGVPEDRLTAFIRQTYFCSVEDFIAFKRLEHLMQTDVEQLVGQLLSGVIFRSGFDSITSLQATLSNYLNLSNKDLYMMRPETVVRLKSTLDRVLTKEK